MEIYLLCHVGITSFARRKPVSLSALQAMQAHQPEVLKPSEKRWSKSQLEFEQRVPVIPRGLVAARVLAFQAAPSKTWSMFSTPRLAKSPEFEAPPLVERKANCKSPRKPCKPLPSVTQPLSSDYHQSSMIPSIGKPVPVSERGGRGSVNNSNLGEDLEVGEQLGLFRDDVEDNCVDEVRDILDGAMDYQSQDGGDSKRGPEIKIARSISLSALGGDVRLPEAKQPQLNMPLTKTSSLGGRVAKSIIPLGSSHQPSTSLDASIQSKKYERNQKSIPCDSHENTRAVGPQITSHSLLYSNDSAAQSQQALNLGPSDPTVLEVKDAIELHYLSPGQAACSSTGESANSSVHRNVARTLSFKEANLLESTTPTRKVRHFMSTTSLRSPSQLYKTQPTLKRWNWWKLGGRKQRATGENCVNPARQREPLIPLESFPTQPIGYDVETTEQESDQEPATADDPTCTFQISKEPETIMESRGFKRKGITSPRNNEIQSRSCVELPLAVTPPELDLRHSADSCVSPSLAADTLSQEGFSDAASTIRLQPDKPNGVVRWRNRGQNFQRVQLVVNLDMRELVVKAKVGKKGKDKLG